MIVKTTVAKPLTAKSRTWPKKMSETRNYSLEPPTVFPSLFGPVFLSLISKVWNFPFFTMRWCYKQCYGILWPSFLKPNVSVTTADNHLISLRWCSSGSAYLLPHKFHKNFASGSYPKICLAFGCIFAHRVDYQPERW